MPIKDGEIQGSATGREIYDEVDKALTEFKQVEKRKLPQYRGKIRRKIEATFKQKLDYFGIIHTYLDVAVMLRDTKAEEFFEEVFYDDFDQEKTGFPMANPYFMMRFEGLDDIIKIDSFKYMTELQSKPPGSYPMVWRTVEEVHSLSKYNIPLLIIGETGTSKSFLAKVVHKTSRRRRGPFQGINCAAIPENMLESELFGYEKGAFTDAKEKKQGLLELGDGGTVFLDEIGKMSYRLQAKILKVIDEGEFLRLGGLKLIKIDVRFIAAAQPSDIQEGRIISDLKYRLNYPNSIIRPNLKQMLDETKLVHPNPVIENSLRFALHKLGLKGSITVSQETVNMLINRKYPGNYRELENILISAIISAQNKNRTELLPEDLKILQKMGLVEEVESKIPQDEYDVPSQNIPLIGIIDYADNFRASIVKTKVNEVLRSGKDLKRVLIGEGLPPQKYQGFLNKVENIVGKGIREMKRDMKIEQMRDRRS